LLASRGEVRARIESGQVQLVDARPAEFYRGETRHQAARVPGTLKGAVNLEHSRWFLPDSATMVSADEARLIAGTLPEGPGGETVSFCNTGHWAATNWFALSELAGRKNVKLYAGSMVDWTQDPSALPMDNVPNRLQQLMIDTRLWIDRTFP
jgi:thiosulfate/3-mercaptopyruvate sulfurtransferase